MKHPSEETLIEWALARLETATSGGAAGTSEMRDPAAGRHIVTCPACTERLAGIERMLHAMATDRSPEPPVLWVDRAIGSFSRRTLASRLRAWAGNLLEETAQLVQAPGAGWAAAGLRTVGAPRRVRFETEKLELDLHIEPEGHGATLLGQVLRLGEEVVPVAHARLVATSGAGDFVEAETDELGEFSIVVAAESPLEIRLLDGDRVVRFPIDDDSLQSS